ncbi:MAG: hypothetical protein E6K67_01185 [Nitrospirae bacterium]|nr:MAG: hypothetical protein E6K67_01185 [Nitrospirota bacterium]
MKTFAIVFALTLVAGPAIFAVAEDKTGIADPSVNPGQAQGFRIVQGEVLKMEGNTYLVRDETGNEIRLTVTKDSKIEKAFEVGDRIVAQVSDQGLVTLINKSETPPATGADKAPQKRESGKMPSGPSVP